MATVNDRQNKIEQAIPMISKILRSYKCADANKDDLFSIAIIAAIENIDIGVKDNDLVALINTALKQHISKERLIERRFVSFDDPVEPISPFTYSDILLDANSDLEESYIKNQEQEVDDEKKEKVLKNILLGRAKLPNSKK
ncbi:MAG: hypothetical protein RSE91_00340 [Bacilli bacterium]